MQYLKKPVKVDAVRVDSLDEDMNSDYAGFSEAPDWLRAAVDAGKITKVYQQGTSTEVVGLNVLTEYGMLRAVVGNFIINDVFDHLMVYTKEALEKDFEERSFFDPASRTAPEKAPVSTAKPAPAPVVPRHVTPVGKKK